MEYLFVATVISAVVAVFSGRVSHPSLLDAGALLALWFLGWGAAARSQSRRRGFVLSAGVLTAALSIVAPPLGSDVMTLAVVGQLSILCLPTWRGIPRDGRRAAREAGLFFAVACSPLAVVLVACALTAQWGLLAALPWADTSELVSATAWALPVFATILFLDGLQASPPLAPLPAIALAFAAGASLLSRAIWILSIASVPVEAFWSDGPFLVNALKLEAHLPLYSPMAELDTYTYSPLIDLLHRAVLAPFGLELSLFANRALVLFDQLVAGAILTWALWPRLVVLGAVRWARVSIALAILLVCLSNLVAPAIHPDHPLLVCVAVAFALLVNEAAFPPTLWWVALFWVTPLATAFKLSGVGIGVGLVAAFAYERRWRPVLTVLGSMLVAAAMVPLFDAFFGPFSTYAIDVQRRGDFDWSRLPHLVRSPFALAFTSAWVYSGVTVALGPRRTGRSLGVALVLFTSGVALLALPAYLKVSGRENNLTPMLVGATVIVWVAAAELAQRAGPKPHPSLACALVLTLTLAARPPLPPLDGRARAAAISDFRQMTDAIREDDAAGRRTLALFHTHPWIAAGHREVPRDRYASAAELYFAHLPEGQLLEQRIREGGYDTILAAGHQLAPAPDLRGKFNASLLAALRSGYEVVYPRGSDDITRVEGAVILRRRAL